MQKIKISVLGCGWLGFPLAEALLQQDFAVNGATTTKEKLALLENTGIRPFLIGLHENTINGNICGFLDQSNILIITVPPKLRGEVQENYTSKIKALVPYIEKSTVQNVLFVSSISVYADDPNIITEQTLPKPGTESGRQILAAEELLFSNANFKTTVVRFGGLIGGNRHPVHSLSGKQSLNPDAPINLIHLSDCIAIILKIIEKNIWNETLNAVTPFHPSRENYYVEKANKLGINPPIFDHSNLSSGKIIDSTKMISLLNHEFLEPQL